MSRDELDRLEQIAHVSRYAAGFAASATIRYSFRIAVRHLIGDNLLELGPAEGVMTELFTTTGKQLTLVEGSSLFCDDLRRRFPRAKVIRSLIEDFTPHEECFDNIILGRVLEHVVDPVRLLCRAKQWLTPGRGRIFAVVPNARSLHRQAAVIMGLLPAEDALNELDIHHGHRRVFNPESFRSAFVQAGLQIEVFGGYWLKPVSNQQLEDQWTPPMVEAFMQLGERYPDIAAEIYVVAQAPEPPSAAPLPA